MRIWLIPLACTGLALSLCAQAEDAPAAPAGEHNVRAACAADFKKLCPGVEPGGGRVRACIAEHRDELSDGCRQALKQARASRPKGAPDQPPPAPKPQ